MRFPEYYIVYHDFNGKLRVKEWTEQYENNLIRMDREYKVLKEVRSVLL